MGPTISGQLRKQPHCYGLIQWPSILSMRAELTAVKVTSELYVNWTLASTLDSSVQDPLHNYLKPKCPAGDYLLVFRVVLIGKACLHLLVLSPLQRAHALKKSPKHIHVECDSKVSEDLGYQRSRAGQCSNCGSVPETLFICAGCRLHSYCSRECQCSAWAQHKMLCKEEQRKMIKAGKLSAQDQLS